MRETVMTMIHQALSGKPGESETREAGGGPPASLNLTLLQQIGIQERYKYGRVHPAKQLEMRVMLRATRKRKFKMRNLMKEEVSWLRDQPRCGLAHLFFDSLCPELTDGEFR